MLKNFFFLIIFFGEKLVKLKKQEKTQNILTGPTTKVRLQFDGNYCEKQSKRTFFRIKKKFQVSIKEFENNWF